MATDQEIKVVTDAIRADASQWESQIAPADRAASSIHPMYLGAIDIPWAAFFKDAVNGIVPQLYRLASGAGPEFQEIASDLRLNANAYENADRQVEEDINTIVNRHVDGAY